ncbi:mechanosensitive ion channel family protein [Klenkia terrae]|uniref:Mechanosensitive ion channel family protein n=1 Tax=Klenkia terrae TaxID=1052259 RepID=A0ABU8ED67_9ACTN|nr:mechanosensitive ion channel family protein [Klenkia terrae]SSC23328.1 Mechanosensitive ion channel MscS [Klenkia terrae]
MDVLAIAPLANLTDWVRGRGLAVVLIVIGSVLLARLVTWVGGKVTARIDASAGGGDALVRSEAAKHRHSLTQVLQWVAVVVIYTVATVTVLSTLGLPVTSLVAPATVLGVGLGFGAQRVVQDVLAGFFLITERQYGFGDVVSIAVVGGGDPAEGTVEDVTLRITRMRSVNGEVVIIPNGQIVKVVNLSRDWARAVIDVPVPASTDVTHVQDVLREVGEQAFADEQLAKLLLDTPSVMGVTSLGLDEVNVRIVARTLPGKQFDVGRDLRSRIALAFRREGIVVQPQSPEEPVTGHDPREVPS